MSKLFLILSICALKIIHAQKCSYVFDAKNVFKTVRCVSLASMKGIEAEIRENWTSIEVVNRGVHGKFSVNAGN